MTSNIPLLLEPEALQEIIGEESLLIVDLSPNEHYNSFHIPDAVSLEYSEIVASQAPVMGLLPDAEHLNKVLSTIGLTKDHHVVAYDNENSGKASRLLWTLDCMGHPHFSLLNGGLTAWNSLGLPTNNQNVSSQTTEYQTVIKDDCIANKDYILNHLDNPKVILLDTRTAGEYAGEVVRAARGGHIPGAINVNWTDAIDMENNLKLKPENVLHKLYESAGVTPDKEIITYCQTHHRSAHSYIVLKSLGYTNIKGYHGAWSEWGNDANTPIET